MGNIIITLVIAAILGCAIRYIIREKKKGVTCIGCSCGGSCGSSCGADSSSGCDCGDTK